MTGPVDVLRDGYGRLPDLVRDAVHGLGREDLAWQPGPGANTVCWLVWHLARVQDKQIADVAGTGEVWTDEGWVGRFDPPFDPDATGYGQAPEEASRLRATAELLVGYFDAVHARTLAFLDGLADEELDRVVDERWSPPVTLVVRLVSILDDDLQHAGQATYVRGLLDRR